MHVNNILRILRKAQLGNSMEDIDSHCYLMNASHLLSMN